MNVIIISIGNELLNGQTINSNAAFISRNLHNIGILTRKIIAVRDSATEIKKNIAAALAESNIIVITGGLGPTHDDITRTVLTEYFEDELVFKPELFQKVEEKFKRRGLKMAAINRNQAMVPAKAKLIDNPIGSADGFLFEQEEKYIFSLPGIPREMQEMIIQSVIPILMEKTDRIIPDVHFYRTTGIAESRIYELCKDLFEKHSNYEIAFLPKFGGVDIRVAINDEKPELEDIFQNFENNLYSKIGSYIYCKGEKELEEVIGDILRERGLTLTVAESYTGGLLQDKITNIPGSSDYFLGGAITYSNESKTALLKVKQSTLEEHGAVSDLVAKEIAVGARKLFGADLSLSTSGIAGPAGATETKPVGLIFIGLATGEKTVSKRFMFGKDRLINKERGVQVALDLLRRELLGLPSSAS